MTTKHVLTATLPTLALGLTLGLAGCGNTDTAGGAGTHSHAPSASAMPSMTPGSSMSASASTSESFNQADVMFVQRMLPHHAQAVTMSDTLLAKSGVSAQTTALAQQIKADQQPEITTMKGWLKAWGQEAGSGMGGMGGMDMGDGMATDAELKTFGEASGSAAEKLYLQMMTKHHQGAIAMAKTEIADGQDPDTVQLAQAITTSQQDEIATMTKLLAKL